ncbi:MAG: IS66 family transposase [Lewinellaceae bacterium]|nr:IS66 family transposase [Lewinellaceae bacterium]
MTALEQENKALKEEIFLLKAELAQLKKLIFGAKRERFISEGNSNQGLLFEAEAVEAEPEEEVEVVSKKKKKKKAHLPFQRNTFPASLRREKDVIEPIGVDIGKLAKIGEDITELLAYVPADLYVKQIIRPRYVNKADEDQGVAQANIPARLIPKGMVDESLVAQIIVEKILFHTPVHRFRKKLKQAGVGFISENNLHNWLHTGAHSLLPLYHLLHQDLLAQPYNQVDETRIAVLSKNKPGATHRGYFWVLYNPELNAAFFQYDSRRSTPAGQSILGGFSGILQADGYSVYETVEIKQNVHLIHCMAHARRKFVEAQNTDPPRANYFLEQAQKLYRIERQAREEKMDYAQRLQLRQQKAVPILEELGIWLKEQYTTAGLLPTSPIGKAIAYTLKRWEGLCAYAHDGQLEIDNNLVENTIRPVALGRKNFLFAGSDEAAQNLACLYSIIGTCDKWELNAHRYLTWLLRQVATKKATPEAIKWLPHRMDEELLNTFRD